MVRTYHDYYYFNELSLKAQNVAYDAEVMRRKSNTDQLTNRIRNELLQPLGILDAKLYAYCNTENHYGFDNWTCSINNGWQYMRDFDKMMLDGVICNTHDTQDYLLTFNYREPYITVPLDGYSWNNYCVSMGNDYHCPDFRMFIIKTIILPRAEAWYADIRKKITDMANAYYNYLDFDGMLFHENGNFRCYRYELKPDSILLETPETP
jgi:hypothetical protein